MFPGVSSKEGLPQRACRTMGQGEAERARVAASGAGSAANWSCDPGPPLSSSELLCSPVNQVKLDQCLTRKIIQANGRKVIQANCRKPSSLGLMTDYLNPTLHKGMWASLFLLSVAVVKGIGGVRNRECGKQT